MPTSKTILVVEDEQSLLAIIVRKLQEAGFSVLKTETVEQAMNMLESIDSLDAVWLDHYLAGEKTGVDFVTHLRGHARWKGVQVFVVSEGSTDKKDAYLRLGIEKYFVKSDHGIGELITTVSSFLSRE